jgi:Domain of unknown function (DUF1918)
VGADARSLVVPNRLNDREEAVMHAQIGDWLVVEGRDINHHARRARVLSVSSPNGEPPFRVRWDDDGHEALVYPGPDCHVVTENDMT